MLPGAFSAYRYIALQNDSATNEGPLQKYFMGEKRMQKKNVENKESVLQRQTDNTSTAGCLPKYFRIKKKPEESIFDANMYLAEDRVSIFIS